MRAGFIRSSGAVPGPARFVESCPLPEQSRREGRGYFSRVDAAPIGFTTIVWRLCCEASF
jgi:hypothetical protein